MIKKESKKSKFKILNKNFRNFHLIYLVFIGIIMIVKKRWYLGERSGNDESSYIDS